ncbi:MAG: hypothetical protein KGL53_08230 [Elusimicrobia bacterium]|nr:hypothetical protein [Elusimicrobiota bacterium]
MKNLLLAAVTAALCGAAASAAPSVDFDNGVDASAVLSAAKAAVKDDKAPVKGAPVTKAHTERDCATVAFQPDGPSVSQPVYLRSTEYQDVCTPVGDPRHGGGTVCHEEPTWTNSENVQIEVRNRQKLYPWERETFEACLEGPWLDVYPLETAHVYTQSQSGSYFVETAGARKAMDPDPAGITAGAPVVKGKAFSVTFNDRWASYYQGETTVLHLALKRDVPIWFDPTVVSKDVTLPAAASYTVDFNQWLSEFSEQLQPGKQYYVEWSFQRVGTVSKDTKMKAPDSPKTAYAAAPLEMASLFY